MSLHLLTVHPSHPPPPHLGKHRCALYVCESVLFCKYIYLCHISWRRKWQPTPVSLPGKSHRGAWRAAVHGVARVGHDWAPPPPPPRRILEATSKWCHSESVFLWLTSLSMIISRSIMLPQMAIICFLVWLDSILSIHGPHLSLGIWVVSEP